MKRESIFGLLLSFMWLAPPAGAAPSQQISVTVTIVASISVSVSPGNYAFGETSEGATLQTTVDAFTAVNDGNVLENLTITAGDSNNWTCQTTVGLDEFVMKYHNGTSWVIINPSSGAGLATGVIPGGSKTFGLQLLVPTATNHIGVQQTIPVTVTAQAD